MGTDSLGVMLPDSSTVAGWLAPLAHNYLSFLGPEGIAIVVGLVTAVALDLLEGLLSKLKGVPVFKQLMAIWESYPRLIGPLLALLFGSLIGGTPLAGVLGAGIRSMITSGSLLKATPVGVKKIRGAVAIMATVGALLLMPSSSAAQDPVPADSVQVSAFALDRFSLALGPGYEWERVLGVDQTPKLWGAVRLTYAVSDLVALQGEWARPFESAANWRLRVYGFLVLPGR